GQYGADLRHHFRVSDSQLDINLRSSFSCRPNFGFVEGTAERVAFLLVKRAHLFMQILRTGFKVFPDGFDLGLLLVGQIQIATKRPQTVSARSASTSKISAAMWRSALRALREGYEGDG